MTTMPPDTLAALKASIKHWQENVAAETPKDASDEAASCALCRKFNGWLLNGRDGDVNCVGCPVADHTESDGCRGSPYEDASDALTDWAEDPNPETEAAWRIAAQAELDFLISLLPEGETP